MGACQSRSNVVQERELEDEKAPKPVTSSVEQDNDTDSLEEDMSTLEEAPSQHGIMDGKDALISFGDQSLSTFDPRSLYGGRACAGGAYMSDGMTLSSFCQTSTSNSYMGELDTDDDSFFFSHDPQEKLVEVEAPAGKLGLVLDTPGASPPIVHAIKDFSPLLGKLLVGDKLLALDDEDVRFYTAVKISKLLSRKSGNPKRVFIVSRVVQ